MSFKTVVPFNIIEYSQAKTQLEEDALELWQTALRYTTTIDSVNGQVGLVDLLPTAVELLSLNLDLLGSIISLLESYILLDTSRLLQVCLFASCRLLRFTSLIFRHVPRNYLTDSQKV